MSAYADTLLPRSVDLSHASARAAFVLGQAVRTQANVLAYVDGFTIVTLTVVVMLALAALLQGLPQPQTDGYSGSEKVT